MSVSSLLLPVFAEVGLTFLLMFWMGLRRREALSSGVVKPSDIALRQPNWPHRVLQVANCFHNQLELPFLFYVLVAFILITRVNSSIFVLLAWCSSFRASCTPTSIPARTRCRRAPWRWAWAHSPSSPCG